MQNQMSLKVKKLVKLWGPPVFWMALIFFFSSRPTIKTTQIYWQDFVIKKTAHFIEYAILAFLYLRGFLGSGFSKKKSFIFALVLCILYATSDEFHQSFIPGREPRIRDVIIDTIGAFSSLYYFVFYRKKPFKYLQY